MNRNEYKRAVRSRGEPGDHGERAMLPGRMPHQGIAQVLLLETSATEIGRDLTETLPLHSFPLYSAPLGHASTPRAPREPRTRCGKLQRLVPICTSWMA